MEEIWKDVPGYEGLYQASTEGNIRSLNYKNQKGKIQNLRPRPSNKGYYKVQLSDKEKKKKDYQWGRIIALTFVPNPENKPSIRYIDKDKTNNKPNNIEWATVQEIAIESCEDKNIVHDGKSFKNWKELAVYYGIKPKVFWKRKNDGWTLEEILTIPVDKKNACGKPYYYNYNGKYMTLKQISKITGIRVKTMRDRMLRGWDLYGACEIPVDINRGRKEKKK